jgi:beta-ribofuranosylaminobenzene 5'-phosphate synthase
MMNVEIVTGSRLHFGLICGTPQTGWRFGGVGVMLRQPSWRITMNKSRKSVDQISASSETADRVAEFLQKIRMTLPLPTVEVSVKSEVPFHTGLGGGTQLGLAIAAAAKLVSIYAMSTIPLSWQSLLNEQRDLRSARWAFVMVDF